MYSHNYYGTKSPSYFLWHGEPEKLIGTWKYNNSSPVAISTMMSIEDGTKKYIDYDFTEDELNKFLKEVDSIWKQVSTTELPRVEREPDIDPFNDKAPEFGEPFMSETEYKKFKKYSPLTRWFLDAFVGFWPALVFLFIVSPLTSDPFGIMGSIAIMAFWVAYKINRQEVYYKEYHRQLRIGSAYSKWEKKYNEAKAKLPDYDKRTNALEVNYISAYLRKKKLPIKFNQYEFFVDFFSRLNDYNRTEAVTVIDKEIENAYKPMNKSYIRFMNALCRTLENEYYVYYKSYTLDELIDVFKMIMGV